MQKNCYMSSIGFIKIKVPRAELSKNSQKTEDIFDQTRIHSQSYVLAYKVASDIPNDGRHGKDQAQMLAREVIRNPKLIKELDINQYKIEMEKQGVSGQAMNIIIDQIIEEFENPFKDPRELRTPGNIQITPQQLLYMMIDESEKTFKKGIIVTATVVRVLNDKVLCKLDNGLDAQIF
mmetsp:Transcript_22820/g.22056  ORF Transcript_22820/g.22056 Transcript_22820/m.22056 type:complete len:178 (-) Transcript_22820:1560-2093(-)